MASYLHFNLVLSIGQTYLGWVTKMIHLVVALVNLISKKLKYYKDATGKGVPVIAVILYASIH